MADWRLIAIRWALYADLGLLFGLLLFALYTFDGPRRARLLPLNRIAVVLALIGIALSGYCFMLGTGIAGVDRAVLTMLLADTPTGHALIVRTVALALVTITALGRSARWIGTLVPLTALAAVAVASLAWSGHAAAERPFGLWPLAADIVHLLAASAWIGALAGFVLIVFRRGYSHETLRVAHRALTGFAVAGTIIVALIVATGMINGYLLLGVDHAFALGESVYGRLLVLKLALLNTMLTLAIINRFRLTPALGKAETRTAITTVLARLRRNLLLETGAGMLILGVVAWLGALTPPADY